MERAPGAVWTIIVAAGGGTRFGGAKQFAVLGGETVLDRSVATAIDASDGVVVVLPADTPAWSPPVGVRTTTGGATRSDSVRAGLTLVPSSATVVVVHDAARPLASVALYRAVVEAVHAGADAAIPVVPVSDTVKRVSGGRVVETVPRDDLVLVQTPQAFRAGALREAHRVEASATDDAALVEAAGGVVVIVDGERANLKLTVAADLAFVTALLEPRSHA